MSTRTDIPESVMESAIDWFDALRDRNSVDNEEFADWLMRSPSHIDAFLTIATLHGGLSTVASEHRQWLEGLIGGSSDNVHSITTVTNAPREMPANDTVRARRPAPRRLHRFLVAAGLVFISLGSLMLVRSNWSGPDGVQYATGVGEQRAVVLEDGSVVQLNTNSVMSIKFSKASREIYLLRGEAIFDVKKDPSRPFRVNSDSATVEAIGTRFNVYSQNEQTIVTVIEGRVAVEPVRAETELGGVTRVPTQRSPAQGLAAGTRRSVEVAVGEQLSMTRNGGANTAPVPIDTTRATAWTQRRVIFDNDSLERVVAEFNRYNRTKLVLRDSRLSQRRISGIFTVDDPEALVLVLESMTPLRIVEHGDNVIEISSRESS